MQCIAAFAPGSCFYYNQLFYFWLKYLHSFSSLKCPNYVLSWIICERTRRTDNIRVSQVKVAPMRTHKFQSAAPFSGRGLFVNLIHSVPNMRLACGSMNTVAVTCHRKMIFFCFHTLSINGEYFNHPCFSLEIRNCALLQTFIKNKYSSFIKFTLL